MSALTEYQAARRTAALTARPHRGVVELSGQERASYLQGLLSNDIVALAPGRGCYATYLTPQGRMVADAHVLELGDRIWLDVRAGLREAIAARLDRLVFTEDVLVAARPELASVGIHGPEAPEFLGAAVGVDPLRWTDLPEYGNERVRVGDAELVVAAVWDHGRPGFVVYGGEAAAERLRAGLVEAGVVPLSSAVGEALRIEAGRPEFQVDMDESTIPLEANLEERAISYTKGCYVGQEVIIRVLHRGQGRVAKRLVGLEVDAGEDTLPAAGAGVFAGGHPVGRLTSAAWSPGRGRGVALAYVQRDHAAPGTALAIPADGHTVPARVVDLPMAPAAAG